MVQRTCRWQDLGVDRAELVAFVRAQGLAVVATRGPAGTPEAALVGIAATDRGEIVFDTSSRSRNYANVQGDAGVALVIGGWHDEVTVQCEGWADILSGHELERCQDVYFEQYPYGRDRELARHRLYPSHAAVGAQERLPHGHIRRRGIHVDQLTRL